MDDNLNDSARVYKIGSKAVIENAAILDRVDIGKGTTVQHSIVGRQVTVNSTPKKTDNN